MCKHKLVDESTKIINGHDYYLIEGECKKCQKKIEKRITYDKWLAVLFFFGLWVGCMYLIGVFLYYVIGKENTNIIFISSIWLSLGLTRLLLSFIVDLILYIKKWQEK